MVLDVVGHIPHHKSYQWIGARRTRIRVHVGVKRASTVFGEQDQAQQGLAEERRNHPIDERRRPARKYRRGSQSVEREVNSRLTDHGRSVGRFQRQRSRRHGQVHGARSQQLDRA